MKSPLLLSLILFFSFSCRQKNNFFPEKKTILSNEYLKFDNFFPIATLDLSNKGIKDKIHVMYVSFDPNIDHDRQFPGQDNVDVLIL